MCTVTFIPSGRDCFITSSRDEHIARPGAFWPAVYQHNGTTLVYPKDAKANGSWIAFTQTGNAAVLLNGAFKKHVAAPPYRRSRGLVFLDIIAHPQPGNYFVEIDLYKIEPFTLVLFTDRCLFEARWDGVKKYFVQLDAATTHIWSSATLYSTAMTAEREQWFAQWVTETDSPTANDIINFHRCAGNGDAANSILMNRDDQMRTISITGIELNTEGSTMRHFDIKENTSTSVSLQPDLIIT